MSATDPLNNDGVSTSEPAENGLSIDDDSASAAAEDATEEVPPSAENPWATPRQEPVNGIVQPRVIPPIGKPTRHTNQLEYLFTVVLRDTKKHKHSWPFNAPVDTIKLGLLDYHKIIKRPMDLGSIEKRLKNCYYHSATECMEDIMTMFNNCYTYNPPHYGVVTMAKDLEQFILNKMQHAPDPEVEIPRPSSKRGPKGSQKKGVPGRKAGGGGSSSVARASRESSVSVQKGAADSSSLADDLSTEDIKPSTSDLVTTAPPAPLTKGVKGVKRKADTTTGLEDDAAKVAHRRESTRPIKRPNVFVDWSQAQPRFKGKLTESLKFCSKIINELLSKKYAGCAWPFYEPVDVEGLKLHDYYDIVAEPMDLGTIKKKLDHKQYLNAQEVADDVKLMCENCFKYNPQNDPVHQNGRQVLMIFDEKFAHVPADEEDVEHKPDLTVAVDGMDDDEKIEVLINEVNKVIQLFTEKMNSLQNLSKELLEFKMKRLEAKVNGTSYAVPGTVFNSAHNLLGSLGSVVPQASPAFRAIQGRAPFRSKEESPASNGTSVSPLAKREIKPTPKVALPPSMPEQPAPARRGRKPGSKNKPKVVDPKPWRATYDFDSSDENSKLPMDYDEKKKLSQDIYNLPGDQLHQVISIINAAGEKVNDSNPEEFEIDFEILSPRTLRELEAFVLAWLKKKGRKPGAVPKTPSDISSRKRDLEDQLKRLGGVPSGEPSTSRSVVDTQRSTATAQLGRLPTTAAASMAAGSASSSDGDSSSSSSDSDSDSSDSDSGPREDEMTSGRGGATKVKPNGKPAAAGKGMNGSGAGPSSGTPTPPPQQLLPPPMPKPVAQPTVAPAPPSTFSSVVHEGAKPILQNPNPVMSAGIGESILDQLLPAMDPKPPSVVNQFELFVNKNKSKEEKIKAQRMEEERLKKMREQQGDRKPLAPPMANHQPFAFQKQDDEERLLRLKEQERERLQRERDADVDMTSQMEMMANFEANF